MRASFFFLFFCSCFLAAGLAAQTPVDSLRAALSRQEDEPRYQTLQQLCYIYTRPLVKEKEGLEYARELMQMAAARRDTSVWVEGCICTALNWRANNPESAAEWLNTAERLAGEQPGLLAKVYFWKGEALLDSGQDAAALKMLQRGIALRDDNKTPLLYHLRMIGTVARIYSMNNEGRIVDSLSRLGFSLARTPADSIEVFQGIASALENLGKLDVALDYFLKAYKTSLQLGYIHLASYNIRQAASILRDQKRYDAAIKYYEESIRLSKRVGNPTGSTYHSLAVLYKQIGNYPQAKHYAYEALSIKQDLGRIKKIINTAVLLAELYHITEQYDSSLLVSREYLPQSQDIKFREATAKLGFLAASAANYTGKKGAALRFLAAADSAALLVNNLENMPTLFQLAAQSHAALGRYQDAYRYQLAAQVAQDSIFSQEKNRLIAEVETRFETQIKEDQIRDLDRENALSKAQLSTARTRQWGLIAGLLLFGLLAFAFYRNAALRKRSNHALEQANADLSRKNHEVQTLLREIHHRVKNNLQIISSLLRLQARKTDDAGALDALRTSQARVRSMALLHQRLYQEANLVGIPMQAYMEELSRSLFDTYRIDEDRIQLLTELDDVTLDVDAAVPIGLITNELITNALKHAFPGNRSGVIQILLKTDNEQLRLEIADDGIGAPLQNGKPIVSGPSFGFELVESLAEKLQGALYFSNQRGSRITLLAPLSVSIPAA